MVDEEEWRWITEHATGGFDHLLIATSLPFLLGRGMHYVEAWSEAVAGGAWGRLRRAARRSALRRSVDLEHWAAFQRSFHDAGRAPARRRRGRARRGAGLDRHAVRRRAPRLPVRGRLPARVGRAERRLAGRVLALPQPARLTRAARDQARDVPPGGGARAAAGSRGRSGGSDGRLAASRRRPLVRQPGGHAHGRRPRRSTMRLEQGGSGGRDERAGSSACSSSGSPDERNSRRRWVVLQGIPPLEDE